MDKQVYEEVLDFDFGFTFIDEELEEKQAAAEEQIEAERKAKEELEDQVVASKVTAEEYEYRLELLYKSITPFLDNLCKNPEKSTIYWPDRVGKIEAYKTKLLRIVEGT
jgi:hypothetical protein